MALHAGLAYPAVVIDPCLDPSRDEGELRLAPMRDMLRSAFLREQTTERAVQAALAVDATAGEAALQSIMAIECAVKATACLISSAMALIEPEEADKLDDQERRLCIPVAKSTSLAVPSEARESHVLVRAAGCAAKLDAARLSETAVALTFVDGAGRRTFIKLDGLPSQLVARLFEPAVARRASRVPARPTDVPEFAAVALVHFLKRRFRLQAMCSSVVPEPFVRPVSVECVKLCSRSGQSGAIARVTAKLHPSSARCICSAHKRQPKAKCNDVRVTVETCGRRMAEIDGKPRCSLHNTCTLCPRIGNRCIANTKVEVVCCHQGEKGFVPGVRVALPLTASFAQEAATIALTALEFEARAHDMSCGTDRADDAAIERMYTALERKMRARLDAAHTEQAKHELEDVDAVELLRRDAVATDLLRQGGVCRKRVKSGEKRGTPSLVRTGENTPLTKKQKNIVFTHGHLFKQI